MLESMVTLIVLALFVACIGGVMWLFLRRQPGRRASIGPDGVQEAVILVKGHYQPSTVVVRRGMPVRLLFDRQESESCSERVICSWLSQERWLPPFAITAVGFIPTKAGDFLFTCALGMYQGRLVVEEPREVALMGQIVRAPTLGLHAGGSDGGERGRGEDDRRRAVGQDNQEHKQSGGNGGSHIH
ncbi:MAG: cupredoxin domain-containing protein [Chloroflexi bacterium]|nr:cupredoxin domain-containing protein [Chloroflexota bacterium]